MKRTLALALLLVASCSNNTPPQQQPSQGTADRPRVRVSTSSLDLLPPPAWWHDDALAKAVNLTPDQLTQLDKISSTQGEDVARLERDDMIAMRDLRNAVNLQKPTTEDITSAGHRVRELRASLLDREVEMLASERLVLDLGQWQTLEDQLAQMNRPSNRSTMPRGRGMGGGRRPFPG
jgi:hypothetical protein